MNNFTCKTLAILACLTLMPSIGLQSVLAGEVPIQASIESLKGEQFQGELISIDRQAIQLSEAGQSELVSDPLLVELATSDVAAVASKWAVELVDGSRLIADACTIDDKQCQLDRSSIDQTLVTVPTEAVRAVWLPDSESKFESLRRQLSERTQTTDRLVIYRNQGTSIDHLPGIVTSISRESIDFQFEGDEIAVPNRKVNGILFYRPPRSVPGTFPPKITTLYGDQIIAHPTYNRSSGSETMTLDSPLGFAIGSQVSAIYTIDYSAGRVLSLTELTPNRFSHTPAFGRVEEARESSAASSPAVDSPGQTIRLQSKSELIYQLPVGYRWLEIAAEIDPEMRTQGHVELIVAVDDHLIGEWEIDGLHPLEPRRLEIDGARRLQITVDYGENLDFGDHLLLRKARLLK